MNYQNYHNDKVLIACNIWKILQAACIIFINSVNCLLPSDFVCCMQNFWKNSQQQSNCLVMYQVKTCKKYKATYRNMENFNTSSTGAPIPEQADNSLPL